MVPNGTLSGYGTAAGSISPVLVCGSSRYLAVGGSLYALTGDNVARYSLASTTTLQPVTCSGLRFSSAPLSSFLRGPDGAVYQLNNGTKQHVLSPLTLTRLGGAAVTIPTSSGWTVSQFPTGADLP